MFDIGFAELLLIGLIALIVIGPKRLPETARFLGYWVGKLRRTVGKARHEMEREFGIDEIKREVHNTLLLEQLDRERRQVEAQFGQSAASTPSDDDPNTAPNADSWHRTGEDISDEALEEESPSQATHSKQGASSLEKPATNPSPQDETPEDQTSK